MKRFVDLPPKLRAYIAGVISGGALVSGYVLLYPAVHTPPPADWRYLLPLLIGWMVLCSLARLDLAIASGTMTLGTAGISLAQILLNTPAAALVAGVGAAISDYAHFIKSDSGGRYRPPPLYRWLFNVANCLLAAGLGGIAYDRVWYFSQGLGTGAIVPATMVWVAVYFLLNSWGVALAVAMRAGQSAYRVWRENFLWTAFGYLICACLSAGLVLAVLSLQNGLVWGILAIPLMLWVYYVFRVYMQQVWTGRQWEQLVESARDGVMILDGDQTLLYVNDAFARMVGHDRSSLLGRRYVELIAEHPAGGAPVLPPADQAAAPRTLRRADGTTVPVEISTSPAFYNKREGCQQALVRDISERLAAVQTEKLRALGQMAAGVAHDFNNALAVILGNVDMALRRLPVECDADHGSTAERLVAVKQAADDAVAMVKRLRAFGRPASEEPSMATVNLHELAEDVLLMTRPIWRNATRAGGHEVFASVEGDSEVYVRGNPAELREALTNLVNNAVHAMPGGGTLRLVTGRDGPTAVLSVSDTGIGMTAQVKARLFEPFYTTKGERGSGLGLFVSYGLITQHQGQIEVVSSPGAGTTFHLRFPAAPPPVPVAAAPAALRSGARVLVVDDEPEVRDVVATILRDSGMTVQEATDGQEALAAMADTPADLVITDLTMPGISGLELARELRARSPQLPILLLTGWGPEWDGVTVNPELVNGVLKKPVRLATLVDQVSQLLDESGPPPAVVGRPAAA